MQNTYLHGKANDAAFSERELRHAAFARKLAAEGMVLLKNEQILPLDPSQPIALFGAGAVQTVKGGLGSGDVNNRRNISIYEGLLEAGATSMLENGFLEPGEHHEGADIYYQYCTAFPVGTALA